MSQEKHDKGEKKKQSASGIERRRATRRPILDTFSVFVVVPKKGYYKLPIHDISEHGIGFDVDAEGESPTLVPIKTGENLDVQFYLNQSLYLPLNVKVMRIIDRDSVRQIGAEFTDKTAKNYKAFLAFIEMLEGILDTAQISS